jgi:hypothetical protein
MDDDANSEMAEHFLMRLQPSSGQVHTALFLDDRVQSVTPLTPNDWLFCMLLTSHFAPPRNHLHSNSDLIDFIILQK